MDSAQIDRIIDRYGADKSWLIMILQDLQEELNYLPVEALRRVAERLGIGLGQVFSVSTFYSSFSLKQRGRNVVRVCDGTACHLRGSVNLLGEISRQLAIGEGQTTGDGAFTLEVVACLGACALAPVMSIGSDYHGQMTPEKVRATLHECRCRNSAQGQANP